jgi:hypothetical protein
MPRTRTEEEQRRVEEEVREHQARYQRALADITQNQAAYGQQQIYAQRDYQYYSNLYQGVSQVSDGNSGTLFNIQPTPNLWQSQIYNTSPTYTLQFRDETPEAPRAVPIEGKYKVGQIVTSLESNAYLYAKGDKLIVMGYTEEGGVKYVHVRHALKDRKFDNWCLEENLVTAYIKPRKLPSWF